MGIEVSPTNEPKRHDIRGERMSKPRAVKARMGTDNLHLSRETLVAV